MIFELNTKHLVCTLSRKERAVILATKPPIAVPATAAVVFAVAFVAYASGDWLGFNLGGSAWPYWPGCGFTTAVLLFRPMREWGWYLAASISGELAYGQDLGGLAISIALANGVECLLCAALYRRLGPDNLRLDSPHAVTAFVSAAFLATMVSTALATVFFATLSSASLTVWFSVYFFVGDLLGLLVIVPFFLSVPTYIRWLNLGQRRLVAAFWAFVSLEVLVSLYVFGALPPQGFAPPLPYLVIPIVVAHTIVFGYAGAATAIAAVSFTGVMITPVGAGPFAAMGGTLSQQVASLQIFMGAMAVSVLYLGAYVTAQTHALWRAADLESELVSTSAKAAVMRASGLIAHDLNNFMQVILSAYETKTWPDSLESRLETLSAQLNGLMRLSAQGFELSSTSVLHCVEKLRPVVERLYGEEVILEVRNELSDQQVLANALQIELCLFVLIQNALDAMNPGGKLTIAVGEAEDCVEVSVTDTGPGMSDEIRANLFEPFKTSKQSGTGFGLYAARQAIEEMGGLLYVSETSPRGTTFIIAFHVHHET